MSLLRTIRDGLRSLGRKVEEECELDEEFRASFDAAVQEKMKLGLSRKEAVRSALIEMCRLESGKDGARVERSSDPAGINPNPYRWPS